MPHTRRKNHENSHKELCCQPSHPVPSHLKCSLPTHVNLPLGKHPYDISMRRSQIRWLQEPKPCRNFSLPSHELRDWFQRDSTMLWFVTSEARKPIPVMTRHPPHASPGQTDSFTTGPLQNTLPQSAAMWSTGAQGDCEGSYLNHFCWLPQLSDNALLAVCTKILGNPTASMFSSDSVCPFPFCLILERSHSKMQLQ